MRQCEIGHYSLLFANGNLTFTCVGFTFYHRAFGRFAVAPKGETDLKSVWLKKLLKRTIFTDLVHDVFDGRHPFDLDRQPPERIRSFGDANPDATFYVIWRDSLGSGFFSNFTQVLSHIQRAEELGMIPVVDFENFRTLYNEEGPIGGTLNAWEYYFEPVSPYTTKDVYRSSRVYFCTGDYPRGYTFANNAAYREFLAKHIRLKAPVAERIAAYEGEFSGGDVLGIHFRGKEINTAAGHSFGPTVKQIIRHADRLMDSCDLNRIFLVTEELRFVDALTRRYGKRLFCTDAFRAARVNNYNLNPRPQHRYLLGLEVLADAELLSRSSAILCSNTGVANHAVRSGRRVKRVVCIYNGTNCRNHLLAHWMYRFRRCLPSGCGGLRDEAVEWSADELQSGFFTGM
jgi:hypothetical protein